MFVLWWCLFVINFIARRMLLKVICKIIVVIVFRWQEQESYIESLLSSRPSTGSDQNEEQLRKQQHEAARRENVLVMRLTAKEQEMQDCVVHESCFYFCSCVSWSRWRGKEIALFFTLPCISFRPIISTHRLSVQWLAHEQGARSSVRTGCTELESNWAVTGSINTSKRLDFITFPTCWSSLA